MAVTVTDAGVEHYLTFQPISKLHIYNWKIQAVGSGRLHQIDLIFGMVQEDYIKLTSCLAS